MKNDLFQTKPDEVVVRKRLQSFDEEWKKQEEEEGYGPKLASDGPLLLKKKKIEDLNHLGKLMSKRPGDFDPQYPCWKKYSERTYIIFQ